jgi:hypothetical protein
VPPSVFSVLSRRNLINEFSRHLLLLWTLHEKVLQIAGKKSSPEKISSREAFFENIKERPGNKCKKNLQ